MNPKFPDHCKERSDTPTISSILNFREENFRNQKSNHEIHENIVSQKFGAGFFSNIVHTPTGVDIITGVYFLRKSSILLELLC